MWKQRALLQWENYDLMGAEDIKTLSISKVVIPYF